jgi:hypothetical protein
VAVNPTGRVQLLDEGSRGVENVFTQRGQGTAQRLDHANIDGSGGYAVDIATRSASAGDTDDSCGQRKTGHQNNGTTASPTR